MIAWLVLGGGTLIAIGCLAQYQRQRIAAVVFLVGGGYALGMGIALSYTIEALLQVQR